MGRRRRHDWGMASQDGNRSDGTPTPTLGMDTGSPGREGSSGSGLKVGVSARATLWQRRIQERGLEVQAVRRVKRDGM